MGFSNSLETLLHKIHKSKEDKNILSRLFEENVPHVKSEDWKYAPLRHFSQLVLSEANKGNPDISSYLKKGELSLIFYNGKLIHFPAELPSGMTLERQEPSSQQKKQKQFFASINANLQKEVWTLSIEKNISIDKPVKIYHILEGEPSKNSWASTSFQIKIGANSQASFREYFISQNIHSCFYNYSEYIHLHPFSKISYLSKQNMNLNSYLMHLTHMVLQKGSEGFSYVQSTGAHYSRHTLDVLLTERNATMKSLGTYALHHDQQCENYVQMDHLAEETTSEQIYKGLLNDQSIATFQTGVHVFPGAKLSSSKQMNRNVSLSSKSLVNAKPQLNIENDDVKCSHGVTVGQMNPDEIFYLESRGILPEKSQYMILEGFMKDLLNQLPLDKEFQKAWLYDLLLSFKER
ncbi:hypothetical protein AB834_07030 [PVC group bacterium (ex Bugula neritina AB1)]|nr:hypothetical protein AB834_07030 [PVC group bacterium (ex Bugula neritina AB1)]